MRVIPPLAITDAMLTSSSAVETAPAAYAGGTTYALNDTASVAGSAGLITVYKSLAGSNTGHDPASSPLWWVSIGTTYQVHSGATYALRDRVIDATAHLVYESLSGSNTAALTDTTKWLEIGKTNPWAMFDLLRNTATIQPGSITAVLTPGERVDSIALLGVVANSVSITITSDAVTVYTLTESLNTRESFGWYDYFFRPITTRPSLIRFDLPPYTNAVITVTLTADTGNAECGACVIGTSEYLGRVLAEAESDVLNFSSVTRNAFGDSQLVPRRNVPRTQQQIIADKSRVNRIRTLRDSLNATPAVWSGLDDLDSDGYFEAVLILGIYKRFTINLRHPQHAAISLELEEV